MSSNLHENLAKGIADAFKTSTDAMKPYIRGGDRPPYTVKITRSMLKDPYFAEKLAKNYESQGMLTEAQQVRQMASGINTFPHGDNSGIPEVTEDYSEITPNSLTSPEQAAQSYSDPVNANPAPQPPVERTIRGGVRGGRQPPSGMDAYGANPMDFGTLSPPKGY